MDAKALLHLERAAAGMTVEEDAERSGCTGMTISNWRRRATVELGARNLPHAVALAYEQGLLPRPAVIRKPTQTRSRLRRIEVRDLDTRLCRTPLCENVLDAAALSDGPLAGLCHRCRTDDVTIAKVLAQR